MWYIGPDTRPTNLGERLQEHGLKFGGEAPAMAIKINELSPRQLPKGFRIDLAKDRDQLRTFLIHG